jgi:hypothetical protein
MRAMFANLTRADFTGRSRHDRRRAERHHVHVLFDEIQIAIYNDDRSKVECLMRELALATATQYRAS